MAPLEIQELRVHLGPLVPSVLPADLDLQVRRVLLVLMAQKDPRVVQVDQGLMVQLDHQAITVAPAQLVQQV